MRGSGRLELAEPPSEVVNGVVRGMVGNKRVCAKGSHEAFQGGDVSSSGQKYQTSMEKLAVQFLGFLKVMCGM